MPFTYNFVDGIGAPFVNEEMFDLARELIDGLLVVSTEQTAGAMRLIMERNPGHTRRHRRSRGRGRGCGHGRRRQSGLPVSGGNIDPKNVITLLQGEAPA